MVLGKKSGKVGLVMLISCLLWIGPSYAQGTCTIHKKELKAIHSLLGDQAEATPIVIPKEKLSKMEHLHMGDCLFSISQAGEFRGYLLSTRAKGRYDYFDYSILYSENLVVLGVLVTVYRSTHGAGICQKKWLSQFEGYQGGELKLGSDIDAVSGGTISSGSLVDDMQRCHILISDLASQ